MQAFDRGLPLPEERVELLFDLGGSGRGGRRRRARRRRPGLQLQRRHQGRIWWRASKAACKTVAGGDGQDPGRQGLRLLQDAWSARSSSGPPAARSRRTRRRNWYVPGIPMDKPELMAAIRDAGPAVGRRRCSPRSRPDGAEDAKSKMGLASLLKMMWGDEYVDEKDARFINDRVHANIQKDGTFSVVPQMKGGVTTPDAAAPDRRRRREVRRADGQADRRPAHRPARHQEGGPAGGLGRPRHAVRLRVRQELPHGEDLRRVRSSAGSASATRPSSGIEIETRFQGLESPAKMKLAVTGCPRNCAESLRQGRRRRRHRRRPLGDLRRRRGRRAHPQGRPARPPSTTPTVVKLYRPVPAVLPGERQVAGAHLRVRAADRASTTSASRRRRGQRGHRRRAGRRGCRTRVDAYVDPWLEGAEPATPGQFRTSLPLEVLPAGAGPMAARCSEVPW